MSRQSSYQDALDPELRIALAQMPDASRLDLAKLTHLRAARRTRRPSPERQTTHHDFTLGVSSFPLRVHGAEPGAKRPGLLWMHGGGYVLGSFAQDEDLVDEWVHRYGFVAITPDYRLAPEHRFPAAIDDCLAAYDWMLSESSALGIDPARVVIAGISAGGGLAAALALRIRDSGRPMPAHQLLVYPMLDDRSSEYPSAKIDTPRWGSAANQTAWNAYLGVPPGSPDVSPYASAARAESLAGLPPTYVAVGALDVLRDESITFSRRLLEAGVPVELRVYPGAPHGFDRLAPHAEISRRLRRDFDEALERSIMI